jgi:hypothetical protein
VLIDDTRPDCPTRTGTFRADADVEQVEFRRTGMGMMREADYRASIDPPCVEAGRCGKSVGRLRLEAFSTDTG